MKRIITAVVTAALLLCSASAYAAQSGEAPVMKRIYVSPEGSDSADGSENAPFATFERAQTEVRKHNRKMTGNIEVVFRGGTYRFDKTAHLTNDDNASGGFRIIYRAYEDEKPIFTGAAKLDGKLVKNEKGWWQMPIEKGIESRMLMVDQLSRTLARYPNDERWSTLSFSGTQQPYWQMPLDDELYDILDGTEKNLYFRSITTMRENGGTLSEIYKSADGKVYGVVKDESVSLDFVYRTAGTRVYIENSLSLLDCPGEYYIDSEKGMLYYIPTRSELEKIDDLEIEYAKLSTIISLDGEYGKKISGITFDGIAFTGTAQNDLMKDGYCDTVSNYTDDVIPQYDTATNPRFPAKSGSKESNFFDGAIDGRWVENINVENCRFSQMREAAIVLMDGCRSITVQGCIFDHIGSSAVNITTSQYTAQKSDVFGENITISNNLMYHIAEDHSGDGAILSSGTYKLTMENNDIEYTGYGGMMTNLIWYMDYQIWKVGEYTIRGNRIEDTARSVYTNDGGAIYNAGPLIGTNIIEGNYTKAGDIGWTNTYGVYYDSNNRNWYMTNNVVEGYRMRPIYIQIVGSQIATNITTKDNHVSPLPVYYYGNVSKSLEFRQDKNVRQDIISYATPEHYSDAAKQIIAKAGLSEEYKHLYDELEKPYKLRAGKPKERYRFKEGIEGSVPVKVTNNTDKPTTVDFLVEPSTQPKNKIAYTAEIPANVQEMVVNIPVTFKTVDRAEVGTLTVTGQFENGEIIRAGIEASYEYVAEDFDCFMVDTMSDGYEETGIWNSDSWQYDIYGRDTRMAKNTNRGSCTYRPEFLPDGEYRVVVGGCYSVNNDPEAHFEVKSGDESEEVIINQKASSQVRAEWELGTFKFKSGEENYVKYTRTNYSKEAYNSGVGAYAYFERQGTTAEEMAEIRREYLAYMAEDKPKKVRDEKTIVLHPSDDSENFNSTTRMDPVILKNGRECEELTNGYSRLHFSETLADGTYEVLIYRNVADDFADKMDLVLVNADSTVNLRYNLNDGKEGWLSLGKYRFTSESPAEVLISKNLLSHGRGIVDDVKFVRVD